MAKKNDRRRAISILQDRTVEVGLHRRWTLRRRARRAKKTNCDIRNRFRRFPYPEGFDHYYQHNSRDFADHMALVGNYGSSVKEKIGQLLNPTNDYPFVIIKSLFQGASMPKSKAMLERFITNSTYDLISGGLIGLAGQVHRAKELGVHVFHNCETNPMSQKDVRSDGGDLPLRYCQVTPELRFPGDDEVEHEDDLSARIIVFSCIENSINDPIWLLPVDRVVARLEDRTKAALQDAMFEVFGNWSGHWNRDDIREHQCVLQKRGQIFWSSYDTNRLNMLFSDDVKYKEALAEFAAKIEEAGKEETGVGDGAAIRIDLERGDALIIDNFRVLHCRKERRFMPLQAPILGRPRERWLRLYYGFPPFNPPDADDEEGEG